MRTSKTCVVRPFLVRELHGVSAFNITHRGDAPRLVTARSPSRLYQVGWRMGHKTSTWIMPQGNGRADTGGQGYPQREWSVPRGCGDNTPSASCSLRRFSAMCWYFGKNLADEMATDATAGTAPVPIGLVHSSIGGTSIQQWMPEDDVSNSTCLDNNCGFVEQLDPRKPPVQPSTTQQCTNATTRSVWSCASGTCSDLYRGMIAPFVNFTIAGKFPVVPYWQPQAGSPVIKPLARMAAADPNLF